MGLLVSDQKPIMSACSAIETSKDLDIWLESFQQLLIENQRSCLLGVCVCERPITAACSAIETT